MRVGGGVTALVLIAFLVAWLSFRAESNSWAWWNAPAVLAIGGRDYDHVPHQSVTLAQARSEGSGTWQKVQIEWPMRWAIRWPVWASTYRGLAPTVVFLCMSDTNCLPYSLEGGP